VAPNRRYIKSQYVLTMTGWKPVLREE
jgi:hypothetical protein